MWNRVSLFFAASLMTLITVLAVGTKAEKWKNHAGNLQANEVGGSSAMCLYDNVTFSYGDACTDVQCSWDTGETPDALMCRGGPWGFGDDATMADFPNARVIVSEGDTGSTLPSQIGIVGEAVATGANTAVGIYGWALVTSTMVANGIGGAGRVQNSADTGTATGVQGWAIDAHAGGDNVAISATANNGANNYALQITGGDIHTGLIDLDWHLKDNQADSLCIDTAGYGSLVCYDTPNGAEMMRVGATAAAADFPYATMIVSRSDTGATDANDYSGVIAETVAGSGNSGSAVYGIGSVGGTSVANGVLGVGTVSASGNAGAATGVSGVSYATHAGGNNIGCSCYAANGANNYGLSIAAGDIIHTGTGDVGWSVQSNGNTACTTTCTHACVFGYDDGGDTIVDCADASADKCLCAGPT